MTYYSFEPRGRLFVKSYRFLAFANNIGKNSKSVSESLNSK